MSSGNPIRCNFPLHWPEGWKRTPYPTRSAFDKNRTLAAARDTLLHELRLLCATSVELSSNVRVRPDGLPYSGQAQPQDKGVAVYFKMRGKDYALACDKWSRVECNIYSIAKHVDAMRAQDRYGVGSPEQAFAGYQKLLPADAAPSAATWWTILGVQAGASVDEIENAFRVLALKKHPDHGGKHEEFAMLSAARDQALAARGMR